jgi:hypothetical protein
MKRLLLLAGALLFASCQTGTTQHKETVSFSSCTYTMPGDSLIKHIAEFGLDGVALDNISSILPNLIILDQIHDAKESSKYCVLNEKIPQASFIESREKLLIQITPVGQKVTLNIKPYITAKVSYMSYSFKSAEMVTKKVTCSSTGKMEQELFDYLNQFESQK